MPKQPKHVRLRLHMHQLQTTSSSKTKRQPQRPKSHTATQTAANQPRKRRMSRQTDIVVVPTHRTQPQHRQTICNRAARRARTETSRHSTDALHGMHRTHRMSRMGRSPRQRTTRNMGCNHRSAAPRHTTIPTPKDRMKHSKRWWAAVVALWLANGVICYQIAKYTLTHWSSSTW